MERLPLLFLLALILSCSNPTSKKLSLVETNAALLRAAGTGDTASVTRLLDSGAEVDTTDSRGDTALHLAIKNRHAATAALLIASGANLDASNALGDTPLHLSIYSDQERVIEMLRQRQANETILNEYGLKPSEMRGLPEIEAQINELSKLLTPVGAWIDRKKARRLFQRLRSSKSQYLINSIVLQIIQGGERRIQVLILAIKLGIKGSEEKLVRVLMVFGNESMAEDYLNSGSKFLADGGRQWASENGYFVSIGPGSNRATWGRF